MKLETVNADHVTAPPAFDVSLSWSALKRGVQQLALGVLYDIKPPRHRYVPTLVRRWLAYLTASADVRATPPMTNAPVGEDGFLGFSDNMRAENLGKAYANGAFPMTHYGPVRWYAPDARAVLKISDFRPRSELKRKLRKQIFRVTFDQAPRDVMSACAEPRPGQWPLTWITPDVTAAYLALHDAGTMHSVEVWDDKGHLVGGLFGTCVGPVFVIESLFHRASNSSKYGLAVLMGHLQAWGFDYVDYKTMNPHIASLGFSNMPRADYVNVLKAGSNTTAPGGHWQTDPKLDLGKWKPTEGPPPQMAA